MTARRPGERPEWQALEAWRVVGPDGATVQPDRRDPALDGVRGPEALTPEQAGLLLERAPGGSRIQRYWEAYETQWLDDDLRCLENHPAVPGFSTCVRQGPHDRHRAEAADAHGSFLEWSS